MKKIILAFLSLLPLVASAQKENADIRAGNAAWEKGDYKNAEISYRNALQINGDSYAAKSNMASALYRQEQNADAIAMWQKIAQSKELGKAELSDANYNAGTAMLKERQADPKQLDAAIESFKQALRLNPNDRQAKYNLAYAQALKNDQNGGGGQNDQQNQDQNQNQNQDQQQNQKDQQQNKDQQNKDQQEQQQQAEKPQSKADAERMADAIQRAEERTKEKVEKEKEKRAVVGGSGKNW